MQSENTDTLSVYSRQPVIWVYTLMLINLCGNKWGKYGLGIQGLRKKSGYGQLWNSTEDWSYYWRAVEAMISACLPRVGLVEVCTGLFPWWQWLYKSISSSLLGAFENSFLPESIWYFCSLKLLLDSIVDCWFSRWLSQHGYLKNKSVLFLWVLQLLLICSWQLV